MLSTIGNKEKENIGDTPNPGKGLLPLHSHTPLDADLHCWTILAYDKKH